VWLAAGIGLAKVVYQPVLVLAGSLALLIGLWGLAMMRGRRVGWVPVAVVWVVVGMAAAEWRTNPDRGGLAPYADGLSRRVEGRIVRVRRLPARVGSADRDRVEAWDAAEEMPEDAGEAVSVDLAVTRVEEVTPEVARMVPVGGGVRVTLYGVSSELRCGDEVSGELRLKRLERYRDPGAWQSAEYLEGQGIGARASGVAGALRRTGVSAPGLRCQLAEAQAWAAERLRGFVASRENRRLPVAARLNAADGAMLDAMLFGDRTGLSGTMRTGFERTGTFHLFVVSGLHIALLAAGVFWGLRRLRVTRWAATLLTIGCAAGYAAMTGFGQPAQRSLGMVTVFLVARLLSRERDSFNALGAAALAMLLWAPESLFEAGFQMTVLAVVAIAGLARPLAEWGFLGYARAAKEAFRRRRGMLRPRLAQFRLTLEMFGEEIAVLVGGSARQWARRGPAAVAHGGLWVAELMVLGVVTELVMALPMALYFHRAAVFALPANMVVIPVVAALAGCAVATFVGALVSPWLAVAPGAATALLLHGVTGAIGRISRLAAADVRVPGPVWWVALAALAATGGLCWAVRRGRWWAACAACALPWVAAAVLWPMPVARTPGVLEVTALDVGQGDSLLVVGPDGRTMLVDAGGPIGRNGASETVSSFDVGEEVVSAYLWSRGVRRLDVVVLTHAHTDHMGGMPAVLENFRPRELWVGVDPGSALYAALLAEAGRLGIAVKHYAADDALRWGDVDVYALGPEVTYRNAGAPKNDDSLVLRMQYGKASVLLEGDAERPSEEAMVAAGRVRPVTLLKVAHHGSTTSSTAEFLAAARPEDAVVSAGRGNPFGHPRGEVIGRLAAGGARLFRVDELGATTFFLSADGRVRESAGFGELPVRGAGSGKGADQTVSQRSRVADEVGQAHAVEGVP
jgi:competence protein ComEC